ncbi:MAG: transcriptional regulator AlsR family [Firmicutes bacterium]|nr:transcriptional regulator AlsR family [Bacillota bacterium]
MDTELLRYFVAVAEHLNFSEAAKQLYITPPTLCRHIAQLEQQLDVQLFIRTTRNVKLTAAGITLQDEARDIMLRTEAAINKTRQTAAEVSGILHIGFMSPFEKRDLPLLIRKFRHHYPKSIIRFDSFGRRSLNEALLIGKIDVAFTSLQGFDHSSDLSWCPSHYACPPGVILPSDHRLAVKASISLAELANEPFVTLSRSEFALEFEIIQRMCQTFGFTPNIVAQAHSLDTLLLMVETGIGIAIYPDLSDIYTNIDVRFIPLDDDLAIASNNVVAWRTSNSNPLIPLFLEVLSQEQVLVK